MSKSAKNISKFSTLEPIYRVWGWALLIWSLYRYFLKLPEWADELIFKPLVFVGPVIWYLKNKEKRTLSSLGITSKNFFPSLYVGLAIGLLFAFEGIAANALKYGKISLAPLAVVDQYGLMLLFILSSATAISEEILSRGFLFNRILEKTKNFSYASIVSTLLFLLLHVPILVTSLKLKGTILIIYFITDVMLALVNSILFYYSRNLLTPILVHVFWNMTVALYL